MTSTDIYALPNATNSEGILGMMSYVSTVSDGLFFPAVMLVIYAVILIISFNITAPSRAFTFASFICGILAVPLAILGFFAPSYMYLLVFLFSIGVAWIVLENSR